MNVVVSAVKGTTLTSNNGRDRIIVCVQKG